MAATTRDSDIDRALRTRFGNPIRLGDYQAHEVAEMLAVKRVEWNAWPDKIRLGLAQLARRVPREAERLAQKLERKMSVSREQLTLEVALEKLRLEEGLDRNGLDQVCWDTLRLLAKQSRPVGRETLAQRLGIADEDKLISEVIPSLQSLGLVEQVAGGQVITDRGRNYLRNEAPSAS
jgi:Holliday junction resolvasome RuvABC ATP-dependent DNA helicase subunit